jgi:hypothetical protein
LQRDGQDRAPDELNAGVERAQARRISPSGG